MCFWNALWKTKAKTWTFAELEASQVPDQLPRAVIPDNKAYVTVWLRSLRIRDVRKGLSRFYGTVHSWISVPYRASLKPAEFQVVAAPNKLKDVDASHVNDVVSMNHRLLGPIPWRGGALEMEVGLFSVKSADLAAPFISVLEGLSGVAGVSFISAALPFVNPIKQGIGLLTGSDKDTILEIGLFAADSPPRTGYTCVLKADYGKLDTTKLKVNPGDFVLLDGSGKPLDEYAYMLFAIEASPQRSDWHQIPEIARLYQELQEEVRKGSSTEVVQDAFAAFRRGTLTSDDLLFDDAKRLVGEVEKEMQEVTGVGLTRSVSREPRGLRALEAIPLFGGAP